MDRYSRHPGRAGFTKEQLVELLKRLWEEQGINPSTRDCDAGNYDLPSRKVFARLFGSLDAAKKEAGLPVLNTVPPKTVKQKAKQPAARRNKVARGHL
jgi:hypothetical protein